MLTQVSKSIQWSHQQQESNMDNVTIILAGLIFFVAILLIGELLAKIFNWR